MKNTKGGVYVKRLVIEAQKGNPDAFVQLIEARRQSLYKIAICYLNNPEDVADVIQNTILTAFEKIGELVHPQYFHTWLIRILINKCNDFLTKRNKEIALHEIPEAEYHDNTLEHLIYQELLSQVEEKYRDILVLYYVEGFRTKEIAAILNLMDATVRTRLRRGREQLQNVYTRKGRDKNER